MLHLTDIQIEQYIYGSAGILRRLLMRWHLSRCPECRERVKIALRERIANQHMYRAIRRYEAADVEAEETLHLPKE